MANDQKYCEHCEEFFPLDDMRAKEWHGRGFCGGKIKRPSSPGIAPGASRFCRNCGKLHYLADRELVEWHDRGKCGRGSLDVIIRLKGCSEYPAQVERFFDVQRGETIPTKALEGYRVHEVFSDSIGRLVTTYIKD